MVDLLGIISFFLLSLVVRKLVVGYLKDTNAGECYRGGAIKLNPGSCSHDQVRSVTEARRLCHHPLVARSLLRQRMTLGAW